MCKFGRHGQANVILREHNIDIFAVCETMLSGSLPSIMGYEKFFIPGKVSANGGRPSGGIGFLS